MTSLVVRKHAERNADSGDDCRDACDVLASAYEIKPADQSSHDNNKGEDLAEDRRPSNRAIVAATVDAVFFRHSDDTFSKAGDNGLKLRKLLRLRERSNTQLAVLRDDRVSAFLNLVLLRLLELTFAYFASTSSSSSSNGSGGCKRSSLAIRESMASLKSPPRNAQSLSSVNTTISGGAMSIMRANPSVIAHRATLTRMGVRVAPALFLRSPTNIHSYRLFGLWGATTAYKG